MNPHKYLKYLPHFVISFCAVYAGFILYFILKYGVDVPYMDQWEFVGFFDHLAKGTLTFQELFKFQGEFRQLFPNFIFVGLGSLTKWNVKYEMIVIFLMACWISYNVYRLANYTVIGAQWQKWVLFFLANLFIFSPFQYENWLFGVQIEYFMPIVCVTTCLVVAYSAIDMRLKLLTCIFLSIISIYSSVNGLICWFIVFPAFYVSIPNKAFFSKWWVIYAWYLATLITIVFYFNGYKTPDRFPSTTLFLNNPVDAFRYFFGVIGNPLRIIHSLTAVINVGVGIFTLYTLLLIYIAWHYNDKQLIRNTIVWIILGLYSLGTTAMITVGRLGFGLVQSLTPRYTSFSLYLIVSIIFLSAIVIKHYASRNHFANIHKIIIIVLVALLLYNRVGKYRDSVTDLKAFHAYIQHGKAGLLLINFISHEECVNKIYPFEFPKLRKRAITLDSLGLLRPGLVKTNVLQDIEGYGSGQVYYGTFKSLTKLNDTLYTATGYAQFPDIKKPADAVILSFENEAGKSQMFTLENEDSLRWKKTFSITKITCNPIILNAWAFKANTGRAYKLKGSFAIEK